MKKTTNSRKEASPFFFCLILILFLFIISFAIWIKVQAIYHSFCRPYKLQFTAQQSEEIRHEMFHKYVEKKFSSLRKGSDKQSNEVLDYAVNCLMCESAFRNFLESKRINFPEFIVFFTLHSPSIYILKSQKC